MVIEAVGVDVSAWGLSLNWGGGAESCLKQLKHSLTRLGKGDFVVEGEKTSQCDFTKARR